MLRIEGLKKRYGDKVVLSGVDLEVKRGEIYGFLGHNGAGKSTTMNILTGLIRHDEGTCYIDGRPVVMGQSGFERSLGFLPEEPKFYLYMSAVEYLTMIGQVSGMEIHRLKKRTAELLALVQLEKAAKQPIGQYSRGMKQRLGMAVALLHDPELLILDEPSSALDPIGRKDVLDILEVLKAKGKTLLLSTHILNDVERVCDRIGILHQGKIVLEGALADILTDCDEKTFEVTFESDVLDSVVAALEHNPLLALKSLAERTVTIELQGALTDAGALFQALSPFAGTVVSVQRQKNSLEEVFMKVVERRE